MSVILGFLYLNNKTLAQAPGLIMYLKVLHIKKQYVNVKELLTFL